MKKFIVAMDDELHKEAKSDAVKQGISLNDWIVKAIRSLLGKN